MNEENFDFFIMSSVMLKSSESNANSIEVLPLVWSVKKALRSHSHHKRVVKVFINFC